MAQDSPIIRLQRQGEVGRRISGAPDRRPRPKIPYTTQGVRFGQRFEQAFTNILDRDDYDVRLDPAALAPERALVFEVIGSLASFANTAARINLEWLTEQLAELEGVSGYLPGGGSQDDRDGEDEDEDVGDDALDDDEAFVDELIQGEEESELTIGRLYVGMPTEQTYAKLRSLWNRYKSGKRAPDNHSDWWALFDKLHDLRPWGAKDRITAELQTYLAKRAETAPNQPVNVEIDLWYRGEANTRAVATALLKSRMEALGGTILDEAEIPAVQYQAALVQLPFVAAQEMRTFSGELAFADEIMSVRPQATFDPTPEQVTEFEPTDSDDGVSPTKPALAALIDGYPVENHALLKDRLDVIELDILASASPVAQRFHGTAMASLILHGDLALKESALSRRLKVVPILAPNAHGGESPPADKLALSMIYRAVIDLKCGTNGAPPSGADVLLINHSVCDEAAPFSGSMSAWARTLDYLSFEYGVLFIVSAGNVRDAFTVHGYESLAAFRAGEPVSRGKAILLGLDGAKARRAMLSPAESVNALTVGAAHSDGSLEPLPATAIDPYPHQGLSSLASGAGLGFNRSVKPDILMPGGRQVAQPSFAQKLSVHPFESGAYGQSVASPGISVTSLSKVRRSSGTSNAAALATRAGLKIADALDETFEDTSWISRRTAPCMLKALIAHGGAWGETGEALFDYLPPTGSRQKNRQRENISRLVGYGVSNVDRVVSADQHRITLLADDLIRAKQRHEYRIPLPFEISSRTDLRRVTMTLAWLSPLRPGYAAYRALGLSIVGADGRSQLWPGVKRYRGQPPLGATRRGTLMHMICEGRSAIPFDDDEHFVINVQTAAPPVSGLTRIDVPYALAVTFEVAATVNADIRESIKSRIQPKLRA